MGHDWSDPTCIDTRLFLACGSSPPSPLPPHEGWAWWWCSCLTCRDPGGAKCAGTQTASATGVVALSESFLSLWQLVIRRLHWLVFLCCSAPSGTSRGPLPGLLLCCSAHQAFKGAPWVGSYSVGPYIRHLMGQPSYCSAASSGMWGEWEATVMAPRAMHDSAALPCFHGCLVFLHRHFPPQSLPSCPLGLSPHSSADLTLGFLHNPYASAPRCCAF